MRPLDTRLTVAIVSSVTVLSVEKKLRTQRSDKHTLFKDPFVTYSR